MLSTIYRCYIQQYLKLVDTVSIVELVDTFHMDNRLTHLKQYEAQIDVNYICFDRLSIVGLRDTSASKNNPNQDRKISANLFGNVNNILLNFQAQMAKI